MSRSTSILPTGVDTGMPTMRVMPESVLMSLTLPGSFSYQIPVEVGQPGEYYFNSCLAEIVNKEVVNDCCIKDYIFTIDDNTGIDNMQEGFPADKSVKTWFDLQGRRLDSLPQGNEIFIMEGKKTVVRINE